MALEPKILTAQPYVDGQPDPSERPDQKSIQWMYTGECLGAADAKGQNGGELNRAGVQIQSNSATHRENEKIITESLSEIITEVNKHEVLLGEIGDINLTTFVNDINTRVIANTTLSGINSTKVEALEVGVSALYDGIGVKGDDTTSRAIYPDITWIKKRLGSDRDQDYNGNPTSVPTEPTGFFYRSAQQGTVINNNTNRIAVLEGKINNFDVSAITTDIADIQSHLGPSATAPADGVYKWIADTHAHVNRNTNDITDLKTSVVMADGVTSLKDAIVENSAKIQSNKNAFDNHITANWLIISSQIGTWNNPESISNFVIKNQEDIAALRLCSTECENEITGIKTDIGSDDNPTSIKGKQVLFSTDLNRYKQAVANLAVTVGSRPASSPATGLTGEVVAAKALAEQALAATITNSAQIDTKIGDVADDGKSYLRRHGRWVDSNMTFSNGGFNARGNPTITDLPATEDKKAVLGAIAPIGTPVNFEVDPATEKLVYKGDAAGFFEIKVSMFISCPGADKVSVKLYINGIEADHLYTIPHWNADQTSHVFYPFYAPLNPDDSIEIYLRSETTIQAVVKDCVVYAKEL